MYTLGQAAKAVGRSKTTLSKAIKSGKMSYVSKTQAGYEIDPSELFRVFPKPSPVDSLETPKTDVVDMAQKLGIAEAQLAVMRELVDELRGERDYLRQQQIADRRPWWKKLAG